MRFSIYLEVYYGGDGAKASGARKGSKGFKNLKQKKGNVSQVKGSSSGGRRPGGPSHEKIVAKEGQGCSRPKSKED